MILGSITPKMKKVYKLFRWSLVLHDTRGPLHIQAPSGPRFLLSSSPSCCWSGGQRRRALSWSMHRLSLIHI